MSVFFCFVFFPGFPAPFIEGPSDLEGLELLFQSLSNHSNITVLEFGDWVYSELYGPVLDKLSNFLLKCSEPFPGLGRLDLGGNRDSNVLTPEQVVATRKLTETIRTTGRPRNLEVLMSEKKEVITFSASPQPRISSWFLLASHVWESVRKGIMGI